VKSNGTGHVSHVLLTRRGGARESPNLQTSAALAYGATRTEMDDVAALIVATSTATTDSSATTITTARDGANASRVRGATVAE
jgi:hypothetical protein